MTRAFEHTTPVLAPGYIYVMLIAILPVSAVIDLFVAPSIYWQDLYLVPMMAAIYFCFLVYFSYKTGPFAVAPLWARSLRIFTELMLLYTLTSNCLPLLDQMTKVNAWPLADWWLSRADEIIGFDWLAYFEFVHEQPTLFTLMDYSYHKTGILSFLLIVSLILLGHLKRVQFHMESVVLTTIIAILISTVTPAYAAAIYYGIDFANYPNFGFAPGVYHVESLLALREASPDYRIAEEPFKGLVTFPSIHTAIGVIMAGAVWRHWLFWPMALYAVIMIPSTPVLGSHYIIDVIAGAALSIAVMWAVAQRKRYAGLFSKQTQTVTDAVPAE